LADAKASVIKAVKDKTITDDESAVEQIAQNVLTVAELFFERVEPLSDKERLDADLPGWHMLPPQVPTFLLTAEYTITNMPEHLDFSLSVISYTKSVETTLYERIFVPFRNAGYTDADCLNDFLKEFMIGKRELTLGSFARILGGSREVALRRFVESQITDAPTRFYGKGGVVSLLNDQAMVDIRNAAAHDERLERTSAQRMRDWAFQILGQV